jgi:hypothetical protein
VALVVDVVGVVFDVVGVVGVLVGMSASLFPCRHPPSFSLFRPYPPHKQMVARLGAGGVSFVAVSGGGVGQRHRCRR